MPLMISGLFIRASQVHSFQSTETAHATDSEALKQKDMLPPAALRSLLNCSFQQRDKNREKSPQK